MKIERIRKLQEEMQREEINGAMICGNSNMFYFLGRALTGYLYIPQEGMPCLFVKMPTGIKNAVYYKSPRQLPEFMRAEGIVLGGSVFLDMGNVSAQEYLLLTELFPDVFWRDGSDCFRILRSIKDQEELELIQKTCDCHTEIYRKIKKLYQFGMTDRAFSAAIEAESRRMGHLGLFRTYGYRMQAHMGMVLAGENGAVPPAFDYALGGAGDGKSYPLGDTNTMIPKGASVLVDISNNLSGYISDMSRTFSVGRLPEKAYDAHETARKILRVAECAAVPGTPCSMIYEKGLEIAVKAGLADRYMGRSQKAKFLGHGVGIEVNELPVIAPKTDMPLQENMILALEPKFIVDGVGAVGLENTYRITPNGLQNLTNCPEEIVDLL